MSLILYKHMKSKRTKALEIPKKVKLIVWERDGQECIFCHKWVPWQCANSHFIKRSQGGLGIQQNIMTNCPECHRKFDDTIERKKMMPIAEEYLKSKYRKWCKEDLYYKKIL